VVSLETELREVKEGGVRREQETFKEGLVKGRVFWEEMEDRELRWEANGRL
jgi:hypothetical protein